MFPGWCPENFHTPPVVEVERSNCATRKFPDLNRDETCTDVWTLLSLATDTAENQISTSQSPIPDRFLHVEGIISDPALHKR